MIIAVMILVAVISAAVMFAAVSPFKRSSDVGGL